MREHYITQANLERASATVGAALTARVLCGARPTERVSLSFTTAAAYVTCKRCLSKLEAMASAS